MTSFTIDQNAFTGLKGKVAVMTGTSSGIGLATVQLFNDHGALLIVGDVIPSGRQLPGVTYVSTDVTEWDSQVNLFQSAMKLYGRVDFVFANAGVTSRESYLDLDTDQNGLPIRPRHTTLAVNLNGCIDTVLLAMFYLRKNAAGGSIVLGVVFQTAEEVALSVAYLAVTDACHGKAILSSKGKFKEIDGPLLEATFKILGQEISDGDVVIALGKACSGAGLLL
ncbi:hypothetical protein ACJZ2D_006391 [Fusarium nematophilum]